MDWAGEARHQRGECATGLGAESTDGPLRELNSVGLEGDPYGLGSLTATGGLQIQRSKADRWIYPKNVPMRRYQAEIAETAIFHNTLVCLPTGLGKTLIAAVVMYNYYSWFPEGKVIFVAPTKPLVDQQREACLFKVSIAEFDTAELTGKQKPEVRKELWEKKRVFFCTPHIVANDIAKGFCDESKFVCLVVDECHRGTGNYPSVKVVEHLKQSKVKCRIVGLSATPGRSKQVVQEIIRNLMTARVEFRNEEDQEIKLHTHERTVKAITVHSELQLEESQKMLHSVMRRTIKPLIEAKVFFNYDVERITRFSLVRASQGMRTSGRQNAGWLQRSFQQAIFLASLMENLENGIRVAHEFLQTSCEEKPLVKSLLSRDPELEQLRGMLKQMVETNAEHPKMQKLVEILQTQFTLGDSLNRVVVFTSLRETVNDIVQALETSQCGATAKKFIGQGGSKKNGGMTQKEQKRILQEFREGGFNTLVATCIGEEGLDIPEVALIICYDGAASPIRDTQRMGRTGRHAAGNVIYLLSKGRQKEKYDRNQDEASRLHTILRQAEANFELYPMNPRMIPREFNPKMLLVNMNTVKPEDLRPQPSGKGRRRSLQRNSSKAANKGKSSKTGTAGKDHDGADPKKGRKRRSGSLAVESCKKVLQVPDSEDENLPWNMDIAAPSKKNAYETDEEEMEEGEPKVTSPQNPTVSEPQVVGRMEADGVEHEADIIDNFYANLDGDLDDVDWQGRDPDHDSIRGNQSEGQFCLFDQIETAARPGQHSDGRLLIDLTDSPAKSLGDPDCKRQSSEGHAVGNTSNQNPLERQQRLKDSTNIGPGAEEGVEIISRDKVTGNKNPEWNAAEQSNDFPRSKEMRRVRDCGDGNAYQSTLSPPEPPARLGPAEDSSPPNVDSCCAQMNATTREPPPIDFPGSRQGGSLIECAGHRSTELDVRPNAVARPSNQNDLQQTCSAKLSGAQGSERRSKRFWDRPSAVNPIMPRIESNVTVVCESSDSEGFDLLTPCHTKQASKAHKVTLATPPTTAKSSSPQLRSGEITHGERMVGLPGDLIQSNPGGSCGENDNASAQLSGLNGTSGSGNFLTQIVEEGHFVTPCRKRDATHLTADTTGDSSGLIWNHKRRATQAVACDPSPSVLGDASQENKSGYQTGVGNASAYLDLEADDSDGNAGNEDSVDGGEYSDEERNGFIDNATQPAMMTQITPGSTPDMLAHYHESLLAAQPPTPEFLKRIEEEAKNPKASSQDEEVMELTEEIETEGGGDADVCLSCGQGGHLLLCDGCNKPHHTHCVGLNEVPSGEWFCSLCLEYAALLSD